MPGASQVEDVTRVWDSSSVQISARSGDGVVRAYEFWRAAQSADPAPQTKPSGQRLKRWTFPSGVQVTLSYFSGTYQGNGVHLWEPTGVTTNLGLALTLTEPPLMVCNAPYDNPAGASGLSVSNLASETTRVVFGSSAKSLAQRPSATCNITEVYSPLGSTDPAVRYAYDATNKVKQAQDAISVGAPTVRGPYQFFIAEGYRAERLSPSGASYAIETLPAGGLAVTDVTAGRTVPADREQRAIDELGRKIVSLFDGQGRVLQRTYPEGDQDRFRYDQRDNVIELRKVAKPGAGLADLVVTAAWDATWNKPLWIKDARANQAGLSDQLDLTYWPTGSGGATGQIYQAFQPAVAGGRPTWTFEYAANGLVSKVTDPLGIQVTTAYDANSNPLNTVLDAANVALRTCQAFDAVGNAVSQTDPRAPACP